ncbi:hypothetical protein [Piscinibacter terrae]|uniref:hypothetical protein n=1 Tax=Piscinibacter terrae TaxID=2496871 RepID=UPI000F59C0BE|nr:hypothetical protein [Albitalea terrae]
MARGDLTREQQELADFLSQLSERSYRAGWMQGIESEVWVAMHAPDLGRVPLMKLTPEEVHRLHAMSAKCGGWIIFDEVHEESFIPIEEWRSRQTG